MRDLIRKLIQEEKVKNVYISRDKTFDPYSVDEQIKTKLAAIEEDCKLTEDESTSKKIEESINDYNMGLLLEESDKVDIRKFSNKFFEFLSDWKTHLVVDVVIMNMAMSLVEEKYGKAKLNDFLEDLKNQHGVSITPKKTEPDEARAVGAFAGGTKG